MDYFSLLLYIIVENDLRKEGFYFVVFMHSFVFLFCFFLHSKRYFLSAVPAFLQSCIYDSINTFVKRNTVDWSDLTIKKTETHNI